MERMAAADPFDGEPNPLCYAVFFYGLDAIFGAGREETAAVPHKRADCCLIEPDKEK